MQMLKIGLAIFIAICAAVNFVEIFTEKTTKDRVLNFLQVILNCTIVYAVFN